MAPGMKSPRTPPPVVAREKGSTPFGKMDSTGRLHPVPCADQTTRNRSPPRGRDNGSHDKQPSLDVELEQAVPATQDEPTSDIIKNGSDPKPEAKGNMGTVYNGARPKTRSTNLVGNSTVTETPRSQSSDGRLSKGNSRSVSGGISRLSRNGHDWRNQNPLRGQPQFHEPQPLIPNAWNRRHSSVNEIAYRGVDQGFYQSEFPPIRTDRSQSTSSRGSCDSDRKIDRPQRNSRKDQFQRQTHQSKGGSKIGIHQNPRRTETDPRSRNGQAFSDHDRMQRKPNQNNRWTLDKSAQRGQRQRGRGYSTSSAMSQGKNSMTYSLQNQHNSHKQKYDNHSFNHFGGKTIPEQFNGQYGHSHGHLLNQRLAMASGCCSSFQNAFQGSPFQHTHHSPSLANLMASPPIPPLVSPNLYTANAGVGLETRANRQAHLKPPFHQFLQPPPPLPQASLSQGDEVSATMAGLNLQADENFFNSQTNILHSTSQPHESSLHSVENRNEALRHSSQSLNRSHPSHLMHQTIDMDDKSTCTSELRQELEKELQRARDVLPMKPPHSKLDPGAPSFPFKIKRERSPPRQEIITGKDGVSQVMIKQSGMCFFPTRGEPKRNIAHSEGNGRGPFVVPLEEDELTPTMSTSFENEVLPLAPTRQVSSVPQLQHGEQLLNVVPETIIPVQQPQPAIQPTENPGILVQPSLNQVQSIPYTTAGFQNGASILQPVNILPHAANLVPVQMLQIPQLPMFVPATQNLIAVNPSMGMAMQPMGIPATTATADVESCGNVNLTRPPHTSQDGSVYTCLQPSLPDLREQLCISNESYHEDEKGYPISKETGSLVERVEGALKAVQKTLQTSRRRKTQQDESWRGVVSRILKLPPDFYQTKLDDSLETKRLRDLAKVVEKFISEVKKTANKELSDDDLVEEVIKLTNPMFTSDVTKIPFLNDPEHFSDTAVKEIGPVAYGNDARIGILDNLALVKGRLVKAMQEFAHVSFLSPPGKDEGISSCSEGPSSRRASFLNEPSENAESSFIVEIASTEANSDVFEPLGATALSSIPEDNVTEDNRRTSLGNVDIEHRISYFEGKAKTTDFKGNPETDKEQE